MADRRLDPEERAAWARLMATVRPLHAAALPIPETAPIPPRPIPVRAHQPPVTKAKPNPGNTLDGGWDRRLAKGLASPDSIVDLHGLTLQAAHDLLDARLATAIARGDRVMLLVTGKPPRKESERPHARGAIRAAVGDWIAVSRHAGAIAAVRGAHPRHGGAGALYIVFRRSRLNCSYES